MGKVLTGRQRRRTYFTARMTNRHYHLFKSPHDGRWAEPTEIWDSAIQGLGALAIVSVCCIITSGTW